ncbi:uncharacterized protein A1O9_11406 [Exophiala aquamarina CBS 119918]|uniref:MI domain-containing protein n=1 Tax=Exophiala aquamarina CBS 119918 TaxID=1182545 RepID=A0A072NZX0_9EURO|nr:uncharacterized protein A1O9_11406 [Exophiala aquamarina CBS 119918]KEF52563.1 hypothetical protein A1O9_11406 [Exophiala aquamarina CBS 119918]
MSWDNKKQRTGIKLPFTLRQELGIEDNRRLGGRPAHGAVRGRKEQRKAERQEKRTHIRGPRPISRNTAGYDDGDDFDRSDDSPPALEKFTKKKPASAAPKRDPQPVPKSILKRPKQEEITQPLSRSISPSNSRSSSPGLILDASSKAFKDRAAQDDVEISKLEKRLGMKKRKRSAVDDGLEDLLDGLDVDEEDETGERKSEAQDWLERKRRKALELGDKEVSGSDQDDGLGFGEGEGEDNDLDILDLSEDEDLGGDDFDDFRSEDETKSQPTKRVRENPYVAPVTSDTLTTTKYVPPSMRRAQATGSQSIERLKRQIQGHLNKLSEANLISILGDIEKLYQSNPRQDVTAVLVDLLLTRFCNKSSLQNTFVILHAAFATAIYKVIGVDFGAYLLSHLLDRFEEHHASDSTGKESLNLISLLSNLFTFHVVSSTIIFDYIRILLSKLTESNTELLLRLIRDCGPQLRQDDPSSLKSIVQLMQKESARMTTEGEHMSVRTKFMIETITDLKNNKMKAATSSTGLSSEHITHMRKALGSLNNRPSLRATEPLRVNRDDIKNSDRKGKWWLVGASWKGNLDDDKSLDIQPQEDDPTASFPIDHEISDPDQIDLSDLARAYGMNTSVRRSIFITLLSSVDAFDAHTRLLKLRLKRSQEHEIPHVLLRCAAGEDPYNPYYALVAKRLCMQSRMKKSFQFALWGWWRTRLGEKLDAEGESDDNDGLAGLEREESGSSVKMTEIASLSRLYANLILEGSQSLGIMKVLDLAYIKERTGMFVELLLVLIFKEAYANAKKNSTAAAATNAATLAEATIRSSFESAAVETPQIVKRLQFFITRNVIDSDLVEKRDREHVKRGCKIALRVLKRATAGSLDEGLARSVAELEEMD